MADAAINWQAGDIFGLGGDFHPQNSSNDDQDTFGLMMDAFGDETARSGVLDARNEVSAVYKYEKALSTLGADLPNIGAIKSLFLVLAIEVSTTNEGDDIFATVTLTGHQHDDNTHVASNEFAIPADMLAILTGLEGAYDFLSLDGATDATQSSTYRISASHDDVMNAVGAHFAGETFNGLEEWTQEIVGTKIAVPAGIFRTSANSTDSNAAFDGVVITANRPVVRV